MPSRRRRRSSSSRPKSTPSDSGEMEIAQPVESADPTPAWVVSGGVAVAVLSAGMGTGTTGWEQGIAILLAGLLMLVAPAPKKVPMLLVAIILGFVLLTALSLAPLKWPIRPEWWESLRSNFSAALPDSWTAQPYFTLEAGVRTLACLLWLTWWVCRLPDYASLRLGIRQLSLGIAAISIAALIFRGLGWEPSWWNHATSDQFGPYGNRNIFATLMALGGVLTLATAYDLYRRRHSSWLLHAVAVLPMFLCVLACNSRSGIIVFLLGMVMWFGTASLRKGVAQRVSIAGSLVLAATAALVILGRPLYERFMPEETSLVEMVTDDGRAPILAETLRITSASPGLGYGLGNFEQVFAITHQLDDSLTGIVHPESDWLWMLMEGGVILTALFALLAGVLMWWSIPKRWRDEEERRGERRLHTAAAIACLTVLLQTLVHPPLHVLPVFLVLGVVCGFSVRRDRFRHGKSLAGTVVFRPAGVLMIVAGSLWLATQMGSTVVFGETAFQVQTAIANQALLDQKPVVALAAAEKAVKAAPMGWEAYFDRASARLACGQSSSAASADFATARYLQPKLASVPLAEAEVWLQYEPGHAVSAWREAIKRDTERRAWRYSEALAKLPQFPELRSGVRALATTPDLMVQYLVHQTSDPAEVRTTLAMILEQYPSLASFSSVDRRRLFSVWHAHGDRPALMKLIDADPALQLDGWVYVAMELADSGKFQEAFDLAIQRASPPPLALAETSTSEAQLERDFAFSPNDPRRGLALYTYQLKSGEAEKALATLQRILAMDVAPKYLDYEMARVHAKLGDYRSAWASIRLYIQKYPGSY